MVSPHIMAFSQAAFQSLESWSSSSSFLTRSLKKEWLLSRLNVTQGLKISISENPWCRIPFLISSVICRTSPL